MASTQQRTPKVTPCRQLRSPQQSVAVAHVPCTIEHAQLAAPKSHAAQLPVAGPAAVPVAHVLDVSHHPQPLRAVHAPHALSPAHGSGPTHSDTDHAQSAQLPVSGPVEVPSLHAPVAPHHPQGNSPVHASQSVSVPHALAPPHSVPSQLQSPHEPALGPVLVPLRHAPAPSPQ